MSNKNLEKIEEVGDKKFKMVFPTVGQSAEADMEYSKAYTKSLQGGLWPRSRMEKHITENGLWTPEDAKELTDAGAAFQDLLTMVFSAKDNETKDSLKEKLPAVRDKLLKLTAKSQSLYNNTAEAKGEEAKIANLIYKCVTKEDGSKYWNSSEEFYQEKDIQMVSEIIRLFINFISDLDNKLSQVDNLLDQRVPEKEVKAEEPVVVLAVNSEVVLPAEKIKEVPEVVNLQVAN